MRKLILSMMVSLDGFIEDEKADISWHVWNDEMEKYMFNFLDSVDTLLFGRKTYSLLEEYWPNATASIAPKMNSHHKIVFSRTLEKAEWNNSRVIRENGVAKIIELKQKKGKDIVLFGGAEITSVFINHNLLDEYRMIINPVILGNGKPLFLNLKERLNLKLVKTLPFNCGNVILTYQPA